MEWLPISPFLGPPTALPPTVSTPLPFSLYPFPTKLKWYWHIKRLVEERELGRQENLDVGIQPGSKKNNVEYLKFSPWLCGYSESPWIAVMCCKDPFLNNCLHRNSFVCHSVTLSWSWQNSKSICWTPPPSECSAGINLQVPASPPSPCLQMFKPFCTVSWLIPAFVTTNDTRRLDNACLPTWVQDVLSF